MTMETDRAGALPAARILLIADDIVWRDATELHLRRNAFDVSTADGGGRLPRALAGGAFDIVLMGAAPRVIQAIRRTRAIGSRPHLVVIATGEAEGECASLLDGGADDYFHMSYGPAEIIARLNAIQRRRHVAPEGRGQGSVPGEPGGAVLAFSFGGWVLDLATSELHAPDGTHVPITRGELKVLSKLVAHPDAVHSRDALTHAIKGDTVGKYKRTTDMTISRLRTKLAKHAAAEVIETIPREGYRLALAVEQVPPLR